MSSGCRRIRFQQLPASQKLFLAKKITKNHKKITKKFSLHWTLWELNPRPFTGALCEAKIIPLDQAPVVLPLWSEEIEFCADFWAAVEISASKFDYKIQNNIPSILRPFLSICPTPGPSNHEPAIFWNFFPSKNRKMSSGYFSWFGAPDSI